MGPGNRGNTISFTINHCTMNWKLSLQIAITHLLTKPKQTVVAMMGVMFGISMFIIMISFMTGVNNFMEDMAMDGSPHVRIYNPLQVKDHKIIESTRTVENDWLVVHHQRPKNDLSKIKNALFIADELEKLHDVEGVAPQVATQVFFNNGPIQISGTMSVYLINNYICKTSYQSITS